MGCKLQKSMLLYEWLDSNEKLRNAGKVGHEDFYNKLKSTSTKLEY